MRVLRVAGLAAALTSAALGQRVLLADENLLRAGLLYLVGIALFLGAGWELDGNERSRAVSRDGGPVRAVPLISSVVVLGVAIWFDAWEINHRWAAGLWGISMAALVVTVAPRSAIRTQGTSGVSPSAVLLNAVGLGSVLLAALLLRFHDLASIPPRVHGDEAEVGLAGLRFLNGEVQDLFSVGWYHVPRFSFALPAGAMALFGSDLWGFRAGSVVLGLASLVFFYGLARRLFNYRVALVSAALLAVSHWHIHFSRIGTQAWLTDPLDGGDSTLTI